MSLANRCVVILYGAVAENAPPDEQDVLTEVRAVAEALQQLGCQPEPLALSLDLEAARQQLVQLHPLLVFNLVESIAASGRLVHLAPALLEELGLPYTGTTLTGMFLSANKLLAKRLLVADGLPTPYWIPDDGAGQNPDSSGPWIIKSVWEHASIGLDDDALVNDSAALMKAIQQRCERYGGDWFAERYIDGRGFNIALLAGAGGWQILPPAEICFRNFPPDKPKIVGYAAKWHEDSFECRQTQRSFAFSEDDLPLLNQLKALAQRSAALLQVRGYARVDFRVDHAGQPWILEVNANPCLSPNAGFAASARQAGLGFAELIRRIVEDALTVSRSAKASISASSAAIIDPGSTIDQLCWRTEVQPDDMTNVQRLTLTTGFFSAAEVEVAVDLVQEHCLKGTASGYQFLFADHQGETIGYTCFGSIPCTQGSYDLYWIVVDPLYQGKGIGRALLERSETLIRNQGGQRIYIETSAREQYAATRAFYQACGYRQAALLEHFYAPGEGKLIYCKIL